MPTDTLPSRRFGLKLLILLGFISLAVTKSYSARAQWTDESGEEVSIAVPRLGLPGASEIYLPQPLGAGDAARARRIFALQAHGNAAEAKRETDALNATTLLGPLLADRHLRDRDVSALQVSLWLERYADQPDAPAMRALLRRLTPQDDAATGKHPAVRRPARALFIENRDRDAVAAAEARSDADELAAGGFAAFRLGRMDTARALFERAYHAGTGPEQRSATAFWAARSAMAVADFPAALNWKRLASDEQGTFYGILAARTLAVPRACVAGETIATADVDVLLASAPGKRAFALLQAGQRRRAGKELLGLWLTSGGQDDLKRSILLLARTLNLNTLANDMQASAARLDRATGTTALPPLHPRGGFVVEAPLIYAVVRHESNFKTTAVSSVGARGLMQLMSVTAQAVGGVDAAKLQDPAVNLAVGQQYLTFIAADDSVASDLFRTLASYGLGLSGAKRWVDSVQDNGDPLLFLEAIPDRKMHQFIESTLAFDWQYSAALHVQASSLDALAAGRRPLLLRNADVSSRPDDCSKIASR
jgi:soluble lytic murein transglycosylase-like protein